MSSRRPYSTPDGQVVSQARQVRQRSRCKLGLRGDRGALQHLLHEVDAAARPVELVAQQLIGRTGRGAEAAVHALAQDRVGLAALGRVADEVGELGLHRVSEQGPVQSVEVKLRIHPPGLKIPSGSNSASGAVDLRERGRERLEDARCLVAAAEQRRVAARARRRLADRARVASPLDPAQRRRPIRSSARPAARAAASSTAPTARHSGLRRAKNGSVCSRMPVQKRRPRRRRPARRPASRTPRDRRRGTRKPHAQIAVASTRSP